MTLENSEVEYIEGILNRKMNSLEEGIAKELELNNVILNKNLIPGDMQDDSDDPSGIRIGVQEITRRGMKEDEMKDVAHFIKRVAFDDDNIKEEVTEYMNEYTKIHYAFKVDEGYEYIQY